MLPEVERFVKKIDVVETLQNCDSGPVIFPPGGHCLEAREKELQLGTDTMSVGVARIAKRSHTSGESRLCRMVGRSPPKSSAARLRRCSARTPWARSSRAPRKFSPPPGAVQRLSQYRALGKRWVQITAEPTRRRRRPDGGWRWFSDITTASSPRRRCARPTGARTTSSPCWRTSCAIRWRRSARIAILGKKDNLDPEVGGAGGDRPAGRPAVAAGRRPARLGRISRGRLACARSASRSSASSTWAGDHRPHINAAGTACR